MIADRGLDNMVSDVFVTTSTSGVEEVRAALTYSVFTVFGNARFVLRPKVLFGRISLIDNGSGLTKPFTFAEINFETASREYSVQMGRTRFESEIIKTSHNTFANSPRKFFVDTVTKLFVGMVFNMHSALVSNTLAMMAPVSRIAFDDHLNESLGVVHGLSEYLRTNNTMASYGMDTALSHVDVVWEG